MDEPVADSGSVLSGELFRALAEASAAITFVFQGEQNVYANPAAEAATGYTRQELASLKFWDIIHPDSRELVRGRGLARQRGEQVPATYEVKILTKQGEVRWLQFTGKTVELQGKVAVLGTAFDITDRVRAQEALAASEVMFRRLVDNALVGVLRTNLSGEILYANRTTLRIFGFETLADLQAQGMAGRYQDPDERAQLLARLREDGLVEQFEVGFLRVDGGAIRVVASVVLEDDVLSGVLLDVTERRHLEREALRAQKVDSLALLAGGLAHDFNNFLASILNNLTLSRRLAAPQAADDHLAEAERAVLRARGLTDQLLTLTRGAGAPRLELVSPAALLQEAVDFALRGSGVACEWVLSPDLPVIEVDPDQITQVVHNLVLNAAQAMPQGGTLRVSATRADVAGAEQRLLVVFEDEGPGIPVADQARIFDPYFTTKPRGSGLGLAAADAIVRHHGGVLGVESQPGLGARFSMELPVASCQAALHAPPPSLAPRSLRAHSVLVLDDDDVVLRSTCGLLAELGHHTTPVHDGALALEAHEQALRGGHPFDLLLLDLTVPGGVGGVQVLEQLRQAGSLVPAILVTGYAPGSVRERYDELSVATLLRKPFTFNDLAVAVEGALAAGGVRPTTDTELT
jgi:PAS domain S-box-containing protein